MWNKQLFDIAMRWKQIGLTHDKYICLLYVYLKHN